MAKYQWAVYLGVAVLSWMLSAYAGYAAAASTTNARISVLESKYDLIQQDIRDIKTDVKELLRRH